MIQNTPYKVGSIERGGFSLLGTRATLIPTEPLDLPLGQRQLVMSRQVIETQEDCRRTVHQVEKHRGNPVISAQTPWEAEGPTGNGTVLYDEERGKFRLWTSIWPYEGTKERGGLRGIYYESDDGLEWHRPSLGQYEFHGRTDNNLIGMGDYLQVGACVFQLPEAHRHRGRFGMVFGGWNPDAPVDSHTMMQHLAFSEDGYAWKMLDHPDLLFKGRCDCHHPIVWNAERQVFMFYRRATVNAKEVRRIAYTESADLEAWTQPRVIIPADELDTLYLYGLAAFRYQSMYLGFLQSLYGHPDPEVKVAKSHEIDIQLAWSLDGFRWDRHPERPIFIPTGPIRHDVPDWGMVYAMDQAIDVGDRVYVYYCGCQGLHTDVVRDRQRHICLGTLRRDGFVSLDTPREGWALTVPLCCPGGKLHINGRTAVDGVIQVAIREGEGVRDGQWPEQWSLDCATDFAGDSIDHEVNWKGQEDLSVWKDRSIRLEFRLVQASLYSFWFE